MTFSAQPTLRDTPPSSLALNFLLACVETPRVWNRNVTKAWVILLLIVAPIELAFAETVIPGGIIDTNTIWSPAGSPYIVQGDLIVIVGVTLEIQPGTVVQFASYDSQSSGVDANRVELGIAGSLVIGGTSANPVTLQAQTGTGSAVWFGIVVYPAATSVVINFANFKNAHEAIQSSALGDALRVSNSTFHSSDVGIYILSGSPLLDALTVDGGATAIYVTNDGGGSLNNVVLSNNSFYGVLFAPTLGNPSWRSARPPFMPTAPVCT